MATDLQKASVWKRISAFLFDIIILSVVAVGFAFLIAKITRYDEKNTALSDYYSQYEQEYGVSFNITEEAYLNLSPEETEAYDTAIVALSSNSEVNSLYRYIVSISILIVSFSLLFAYLILEFLVPILFGNGQTLGKKIFSLGVMTTDGIRLPNLLLAARTVLGKFTIETMIPAFIIIMIFFNQLGRTGLIVLVLILFLEIGIMIGTHTNSLIHDLIAGTVVIDFPSQMIFESQEELIQYKEEKAREKAEAPTFIN